MFKIIFYKFIKLLLIFEKLIALFKNTIKKDEYLNKLKVSISTDVMALIEPTNSKIVRFYDIISGK